MLIICAAPRAAKWLTSPFAVRRLKASFQVLLGQLKPSLPIFSGFSAVFTDKWNEKRELVKDDADTVRRKIMQIERKSEQLMDRVVEADSPTLITGL